MPPIGGRRSSPLCRSRIQRAVLVCRWLDVCGHTVFKKHVSFFEKIFLFSALFNLARFLFIYCVFKGHAFFAKYKAVRKTKLLKHKNYEQKLRLRETSNRALLIRCTNVFQKQNGLKFMNFTRIKKKKTIIDILRGSDEFVLLFVFAKRYDKWVVCEIEYTGREQRTGGIQLKANYRDRNRGRGE